MLYFENKQALKILRAFQYNRQVTNGLFFTVLQRGDVPFNRKSFWPLAWFEEWFFSNNWIMIPNIFLSSLFVNRTTSFTSGFIENLFSLLSFPILGFWYLTAEDHCPWSGTLASCIWEQPCPDPLPLRLPWHHHPWCPCIATLYVGLLRARLCARTKTSWKTSKETVWKTKHSLLSILRSLGSSAWWLYCLAFSNFPNLIQWGQIFIHFENLSFTCEQIVANLPVFDTCNVKFSGRCPLPRWCLGFCKLKQSEQ